MAPLLLTGFEAFNEYKINSSREVVKHLANSGKLEDAVTAILPVNASQAPAMISDLLIKHQPNLCVMLGQLPLEELHSGAALSVERVAINLCDFSIPDNADVKIVDEPIIQDAPVMYFSTAPVRRVVEAINAAGIPAYLSLSAGAFLCNMVYYVALHLCATRRLATRCLFIHLPLLPSQLNEFRNPSKTIMELESMCNGVLAAIHACQSA